MLEREADAQQGLIVLDAAQLPDTMRASERVEDRGGHVLHRYGTRILISNLPAQATKAFAGAPGVVRQHTGVVADVPSGLSETEGLGVNAWNLRQSRGFIGAKDRRPHDGLRWDATGVAPGPTPPDGPGMEHVTETTALRAVGLFGEDTSLYLIGSVAVGLLLVDGPTPDLQFTEDEKTKIVAEYQEGLGWLALREPRASVTFAYDIQVVRIAIAPDSALSGYEALESRWRDPAMAALGFAADMSGVTNYVTSLRR